MTRVRRRFLVEGRVQGVGFRSWTARTAFALDLSGWVRNLPGDSVEVEAQGALNELEELEKLLWKGPSSSRVDRVTRIDRPIVNGESSFTILHF